MDKLLFYNLLWTLFIFKYIWNKN